MRRASFSFGGGNGQIIASARDGIDAGIDADLGAVAALADATALVSARIRCRHVRIVPVDYVVDKDQLSGLRLLLEGPESLG